MDENTKIFNEWAKGVVGKTEKEVTDAVIQNGGEVRVTKRDGEIIIGLLGVVENRANLVIENGIVTEITFG